MGGEDRPSPIDVLIGKLKEADKALMGAVLVLGVLVGIVISMLASYVSSPASQVAESAKLWLEGYLSSLGLDVNMELESFSDEGSVYKLVYRLEVGNEILRATVFASKDGRYIFLQGIDTASITNPVVGGFERVGFKIPKSDKPRIELFVMSYCPYGTQMEKALLPVLDLLGDKVDFELKFVNYVLKGEKEVYENLRQYCIQREYGREGIVRYLKCFTQTADAEGCMEEAGIDPNVINACMEEVDRLYGISDIVSAYKERGINTIPFPIYDTDNQKYGVRGSPTLVINGVVLEGVERSPEALKRAICSAFENPPPECNTPLDNTVASPGFGSGTVARAAPSAVAACGGG